MAKVTSCENRTTLERKPEAGWQSRSNGAPDTPEGQRGSKNQWPAQHLGALDKNQPFVELNKVLVQYL